MNSLSDNFTLLYNKVKGYGFAETIDSWSVLEKDKGSKMDTLIVISKGVFKSYDHRIFKNVERTTSQMSSYLKDYDCDGFSFLSNNGSEHIIFVELKSRFDTKDIERAFHQIVFSFIKLHTWMSLCRGYKLSDLPMHLVVACKNFEDANHKAGVINTISTQRLAGKKTITASLLNKLINRKHIKVKLSEIDTFSHGIFPDEICNKEVDMYLQLTNSSSATIDLL